ncbi:MAG: hypothetical protein Unbinned4409contig1001_3 [Prokaryotic dsDNA virus sp.]|nr:MAG: hypothetical protein Unbinned4409contig1001_3 [Prokaryotic dsDNA virus sp.]|tara:strand:- start:3252 stop:3644 length:393 start_codon:yes stop_codon:yes gene_type:complete
MKIKKKNKKKSKPINYDIGPAYSVDENYGSRTTREDHLKRKMKRDGVNLELKHVRRADGSEYTRSVDSSPANYGKGGKVYKKGGKNKSYGMGGKMKYKKGGKFPDLNKDGKITKADILMGRGVGMKKKKK